jgi:hypothetical protein
MKNGTLHFLLHFPARATVENCKAMNTLDEYRRNAQECERMAEKASNPADKASWLRLAAAWLAMIKPDTRRFFASDRLQAAGTATADGNGGGNSRDWPEPSEEDSKASH